MDSTDPDVVNRVKAAARGHGSVLVIPDSNHTRDHVATDRIMKDIADVPRAQPEWRTDNPASSLTSCDIVSLA